jgi:hypothetical protein
MRRRAPRSPEELRRGAGGALRGLSSPNPSSHVIERIVALLGLRVHATSPWVDALTSGWLAGADQIS